MDGGNQSMSSEGETVKQLCNQHKCEISDEQMNSITYVMRKMQY